MPTNFGPMPTKFALPTDSGPTKASGHRPKFRPKFRGHRPKIRGHRPKFRGHRPKLHGHRPKFRGHRPKLHGHRPEFVGMGPEFVGVGPKFVGIGLNFGIRGRRPEICMHGPKIRANFVGMGMGQLVGLGQSAALRMSKNGSRVGWGTSKLALVCGISGNSNFSSINCSNGQTANNLNRTDMAEISVQNGLLAFLSGVWKGRPYTGQPYFLQGLTLEQATEEIHTASKAASGRHVAYGVAGACTIYATEQEAANLRHLYQIYDGQEFQEPYWNTPGHPRDMSRGPRGQAVPGYPRTT